MRCIYLDNAATTYPKPREVVTAVQNALTVYGGNPGRGSHPLAQASSGLLYDCRCAAAELFHAAPERIVFTANATHALNLAIKGLATRGKRILLDNYAHNASYRPAMALQKEWGCEVGFYDASGEDEETLRNLSDHLKGGAGLVIATHASNICSRRLPVEKIGKLCRLYNVPLVVDASQSAGHLPVDTEKIGAAAICMPGHKGLYGPMGSGLLIAGENIRFRTLEEGGAGIRSLEVGMPEELPERLEAGTVAVPAIAGLLAGIRFVQKTGVQTIREKEEALSAEFLLEAAQIDGLSFHGETNGGVLSFTKQGYTPTEIGEILADSGICVRTGYHCAPIAHKTLGTLKEGTVRISLSWYTAPSELDILIRTLKNMENRT